MLIKCIKKRYFLYKNRVFTKISLAKVVIFKDLIKYLDSIFCKILAKTSVFNIKKGALSLEHLFI